MDWRSWSKTKVTRTTWWELEIIYGELNWLSSGHLQNDFDIWNSALEFFQFLYLECYKPVRCILLLAIWLRTWIIVTLKLFSNFHAPYLHLHKARQSLSLHKCRSAPSGRSCRLSSRRSRRSRWTSSGLKWSICRIIITRIQFFVATAWGGDSGPWPDKAWLHPAVTFTFFLPQEQSVASKRDQSQFER